MHIYSLKFESSFFNLLYIADISTAVNLLTGIEKARIHYFGTTNTNLARTAFLNKMLFVKNEIMLMIIERAGR